MEDGRLKYGKMERLKIEIWKDGRMEIFNLSIFQSFNLPSPSPTLAILS